MGLNYEHLTYNNEKYWCIKEGSARKVYKFDLLWNLYDM